jgi:hypothetical protein
MKKFIVTTTIQAPTEATLKFASMRGWNFIVVGDQKTPHQLYESMDIIYMTPEYQERMYPELSESIGWNCIMRRNLGFIEAYRRGAEIIASVDDDNIPYSGWGENMCVGQEEVVGFWKSDDCLAFDPLSMTSNNELWHRGFPLNEISKSRNPKWDGEEKTKILFEVGLWDGDPDVDAICRIMYNPKNLKLFDTDMNLFSSHLYAPFNSQNVFIAREAIGSYMVLPFVGRMDDIWGGYIAQYLLNTRPVFNGVTTYQKRNPQSLKKNLEDECFGYLTTEEFIKKIQYYEDYLPQSTKKSFEIYRKLFE